MGNIPTLPNALARFEEACRTHAFIGSQPPERHEGIQQQYDTAKTNLMRAISAHANNHYNRGVDHGMSRARSSPGNGDMGG